MEMGMEAPGIERFGGNSRSRNSVSTFKSPNTERMALEAHRFGTVYRYVSVELTGVPAMSHGRGPEDHVLC
jgi:hypothetical protein